MGGYRKKAHYLVLGADMGVSQRSINSLNLQSDWACEFRKVSAPMTSGEPYPELAS